MFIYHQRCPIIFRFVVVLFFLHTGFIASVKATQSGEEKVTIVAKNVPLRDVFKSITKQTGYHLFYSPEVVNVLERVSLEVKQQPVDNVLRSLLGNKNLTWVYNEDAIAIRVKEKAPDEKKRIDRLEDDSLTNPLLQTVTGKVTDANGNAIPGATVVVKGTREGATADVEGKFTLSNVRTRSVLVITSIGYEPRELMVKGKSILAQLNMDVQSLDETVVIAYGTTSRRFSTGNITTVKAEEIQRQPVNNPLLALQGRVPGLFIEQASGVAGGGVRIRIQGQNSLLNGNDPLYVIDGVPYSSQLLPNVGSILGSSGSGDINVSGSPLNFINPANIESISVLKDADATAIYGSRAANGAVLITTKKGKAGKTQVNVNAQTGWSKVSRKLDVLNAQQYLQMRHEAKRNDNLPINSTDYDLNGLWDTTRNTDWQKELIGKTAQYNDIQVSLSGGSENTQYVIGSGFRRETSVFPGDFSDKKGSLHFNIRNTSANKKFSITLSGNYMIDNNHLPNRDLTASAIKLAPVAPKIYNHDGSLNWQLNSFGNSTWANPFSALLEKYQNKTTNLVSNAYLTYSILPGLDISSSLGYTNLQSNDVSTAPLSSVAPDLRPFRQPSAAYGNNNINSWIIEPQINFKRQIGKGNLDALLGASVQQTNSQGQVLIGIGYPSDLVLNDIKSAAEVTVRSTDHTIYRYNAVFARLNYNLQDKYILNLTARRDASSRFGSENQSHNFGSIAGAWIFSNESVVQQTIGFLSFGKLRASFGTTGNDQITDYRFLNLYERVSSDIAYGGGTGLEPTGLVNPYLQWEETKKLQFGLDLGFVKDRILLNTNYFRNRSSNQLLSYVLPSITGSATIDRNFPATVQNSGWEITLNTINVKNSDFGWSSSFNITLPKNKLVAFPNLEESPYASEFVIGEPITSVKVFKLFNVDPQTGTYTFTDSKGNPTTTPILPDDRTVIINTSPKYYGGLVNNFQFKGLELDFLLQFVNQKALNYALGGIRPGNFNLGSGNQPTTVMERWQKPGDIVSIQRYSSDRRLASQFASAQQSDAAYSDASYIRLKNVSLSYLLPLGSKNKLHLQKVRFFIQGQNLLTFTNYKGLDPETKSSATLPPLRTLTLGVNLVL